MKTKKYLIMLTTILATLLIPTLATSYNYTDGLLMKYYLNETNGSAIDYSGNNYDLQENLTQGGTTTNDNFGRLFNGKAQLELFNSAPISNFTNGITIYVEVQTHNPEAGFRIYLDAPSQSDFISLGQGQNIFGNKGFIGQTNVIGTNFNPPSGLTPEQNYEAILVYNTTTGQIKLFVDGINVENSSSDNPLEFIIETAYLSTNFDESISSSNISFRNLAVWNRSMTDDEAINASTLFQATTPTIDYFTASNTTIIAGTTITLNWSVTGSTNQTITPTIGSVQATNTTNATPTTNTTYTLTATNEAGTTNQSITITVYPIGTIAIPTNTIDQNTTTEANVSNSNVYYGQSWIPGQGNTEPVNTITNMSIKLKINSGTQTGINLTIYEQTNVASGTPEKAVLVGSLRNDEQTINTSFQNILFDFPTPIEITNGSGYFFEVHFDNNTPIAVSLDGDGVSGRSYESSDGSSYSDGATDIEFITYYTHYDYVGFEPNITSLNTTNNTINNGTTITLSWNVEYAANLDLNSINVTNNTTLNTTPTTTTTYTLTATNDFGTTNQNITITVNTPLPIINTFTTNNNNITIGQTTTLNWSVINATSVTINQGIGSVLSTGNTNITPTTTTTYTLTATNTYGTTNQNITITVNPLPPAYTPTYTTSDAAPAATDIIVGIFVGIFALTTLIGVGYAISKTPFNNIFKKI